MRFFIILKNRLRVLFSDKLFVITMIIVPIMLSLVTGYAQRQEKLGYIPIMLVDEDNTEYSELLCERLVTKEGLKVNLGDRKEALKQLEKNNFEAAVIIKKGFEEGLQKGDLNELITLFKVPSSYSAELIKEIVCSQTLRIYGGAFTLNWINESFNNKGVELDLSLEDTAIKVEEYWRPQPLMTIIYEEIEVMPAGEDTVTIPPFAAASLGLLILFIMMGLLFGSGWLCEEKVNGTIQRATSVKGAIPLIFLGNTAALFLMGVFITFIFAGVQRIFFKTALISGFSSLLVIIIYIFCAASISIFFSTVFETPHQLQASAPVMSLITGIMGGCLWNFAGVPKSLTSMALITPQGWALRALTNLYATPDNWKTAASAVITLLCVSVILQLISYAGLKRAMREP